MKNAWKVLWTDGGKRYKKWFEGDPSWDGRNGQVYEKPLEAAVAFAKELKAKGLKFDIVSGRKAFIQTRELRTKPGPEYTWCPYCIKWRKFKLVRIRRTSYVGTPANRCPVCTISDENYWVQRYNGREEHLTLSELTRKLRRK